MSWRVGSAFTPLGAANTAITVTTTTAIASGERVILVVFREQAATGTAAGNPTVSTLDGNAFATLAINELFLAPFYTGLSFHSFIAPAAIALSATLTVTPGNANQKTAAMLIIQGDPHPTQVPYAQILNGRDVSGASWPGFPFKGMTWDKRLLISVYAGQSSGAANPWSQVIAVASTPMNGFIEALDTTQFSYGFGINIREQDSTDSELPSDSAGVTNQGAYPATGPSQGGCLNLVRAGAVQASVGPDVLEYNDVPSLNQLGSSARALSGQLWP
jgi:hypothetical protein